MKKRYSNEQIAYALRQAESGMQVQEVCRKIGVTDPFGFAQGRLFYRWKKRLEVVPVV